MHSFTREFVDFFQSKQPKERTQQDTDNQTPTDGIHHIASSKFDKSRNEKLFLVSMPNCEPQHFWTLAHLIDQKNLNAYKESNMNVADVSDDEKVANF